ncbi:hypothetical protein ADUPG1_007774 [Aduncisulcus paluster]|uniref:Protein kinase domain-containing protein n=1 Tax=Aduncisulcus paluster TaxID=2918883 RepID=A0ABQ5KPI2_9EUKA|nr:hypothetical protein ADUPG1_007774 [Aduncisulcus paluster]
MSPQSSNIYTIIKPIDPQRPKDIEDVTLAEFVHNGGQDSIPIPRDDPAIINPHISCISGKDERKDKKYRREYDQSAEAQKMMIGKWNNGKFTSISIPFRSSTPIKGAYICIEKKTYFMVPNTFLCFIFSTSKKGKIFKKYEFPELESICWFYLPIDLADIVLCEIEGERLKEKKKITKKCFSIRSIVFIHRKKTPEEVFSREVNEIALKKLWTAAEMVKPEFIKEGDRLAVPISRDDPSILTPIVSMVESKDDSKSKESTRYDQSLMAQKMLKGEGGVYFSHLSVPFPSPILMKGIFICVDISCSPTFLFLFTHSDGQITSKMYEFARPKYYCEWYYLLVDLSNVIMCEIEGKGSWKENNSRYYRISSLMFKGTVMSAGSASSTFSRGTMQILSSSGFVSSIGNSSSTCGSSSTISKQKEDKEEAKKEEEKDNEMEDKHSHGEMKDSSDGGETKDKDQHDQKNKDKHKHKHKRKHPHIRVETLKSSKDITPLCVIGHGGFGEVLLVEVDGIPCVLKKMLRMADEKVVEGCKKEFKMQLRLFNDPKCFNRIPRPLYILDLLDADMKGVYGFLMEFCAGGSVKDFAKRWCTDDKYFKAEDENSCGFRDEDSESSFESSYSDSVGMDSQQDDILSFNPMTLNPVKVSALCVGMIECLDDVFIAKPTLVHRDVKPDNFLVRVDPDSKKCTVVLADLGLAQIQHSISSFMSSSMEADISSSLKITGDKSDHFEEEQKSSCGTPVYNSFEALKEGTQSQKSDGYSLGLSMLSLFTCIPPFLGHPALVRVKSDIYFMAKLSELIETGLTPKLSNSPLFKSLLTIEGGKYEPVYHCLNEVFNEITQFDVDLRMSVHEAREKVQTIKHLLPEIGEGWKCPSIDDIIDEHLHKPNGSVSTIQSKPMDSICMQNGWDDSQQLSQFRSKFDPK